MLEKLLHDIADAAQQFLSALMPAAIGAAVGQAWEKGVSWSQRLLQWIVGICVSYYAGLLIVALWDLGPFAADAVSFFLGMVAFKATPRFIQSAVDVVAALPTGIRDWILPKKDDAP